MKCPKCGSVNINTERRPNGYHTCLKCNYKWRNEHQNSLSIAEKLLWLVENVFQINIINNGCSIEIRPNNSCEEARYFIGVDAAYEWAKENK